MSFADAFDKHCIIHAPFVSPERRTLFERELAKIGARDYWVEEARPIADEDPRLARYPERARLSLYDALFRVLDRAETAGWQSVMILQDDVVFRSDFARRWAEVEPEVRSAQWGLLALYRWPSDGHLLTLENPRAPTRLVTTQHNLCLHAVAVRRHFYGLVRGALELCMDKRWNPDFVFGVLSSMEPGSVVATTHNIAGQRAGLKSALTPRFVRPNNFYASFRSARSPFEARAVELGFRLAKSLRQAKDALRSS